MGLSDLENMDVMIWNFLENDFLNHSVHIENDVESTSAGLQENTNRLGKDFRSLLNGKSRGNSDIALETVRIFNEQLTKILEESKKSNFSNNSGSKHCNKGKMWLLSYKVASAC